MIQVTPQMRILLAVQPADFRKGIDGLAQGCRQVLKKDPFSGYVFIFRNKRDIFCTAAALQIRSALVSRKCKMTATPKNFMFIRLQSIGD